MQQQQKYREAAKAIQVHRISINALSAIGISALTYCLLSFLTPSPNRVKGLAAVSVGVFGFAILSVLKESPVDEALASWLKANEEFYEEGRKQAILNRSSDFESIQKIHKEGKQLREDMQYLSTLIVAQSLPSDDQYNEQLAAEISQGIPANGYIYYADDVSGLLEPGTNGDTIDCRNQSRNSGRQQPTSLENGKSEPINFLAFRQKRIQESQNEVEPAICAGEENDTDLRIIDRLDSGRDVSDSTNRLTKQLSAEPAPSTGSDMSTSSDTMNYSDCYGGNLLI